MHIHLLTVGNTVTAKADANNTKNVVFNVRHLLAA